MFTLFSNILGQTCGEVKQSYQNQGCCGNPANQYTSTNNTRPLIDTLSGSASKEITQRAFYQVNFMPDGSPYYSYTHIYPGYGSLSHASYTASSYVELSQKKREDLVEVKSFTYRDDAKQEGIDTFEQELVFANDRHFYLQTAFNIPQDQIDSPKNANLQGSSGFYCAWDFDEMTYTADYVQGGKWGYVSTRTNSTVTSDLATVRANPNFLDSTDPQGLRSFHIGAFFSFNPVYADQLVAFLQDQATALTLPSPYELMYMLSLELIPGDQSSLIAAAQNCVKNGCPMD